MGRRGKSGIRSSHILNLLVLGVLLLLSACGANRNSNPTFETEDIQIITMELEGSFQGRDVFIQNPMMDDGFCIKYIEVNGLRVKDSGGVQQTAIQIGLTSLELDTGEVVKINIYHRSDCRPHVLNPVVH